MCPDTRKRDSAKSKAMLGGKSKEERNPIASPSFKFKPGERSCTEEGCYSSFSNHGSPSLASRRTASLVGSSATFNRVGKKCTEIEIPKASPKAQIFLSNG